MLLEAIQIIYNEVALIHQMAYAENLMTCYLMNLDIKNHN